MKNDPDARGIAVCGGGIGISIAVNRFPWVRAALVSDATAARLCREHNDANVLALGQRLTGTAVALIVSTPLWPRHSREVVMHPGLASSQRLPAGRELNLQEAATGAAQGDQSWMTSENRT